MEEGIANVGTIEVIQRLKILRFLATVCSKEYFLIMNQIFKILKQTNPYHRSFSLISTIKKIFQNEFHSNWT